MKLCIACKATKPLTAFPIDRNRKDGLYPYCRECHSAKERKRLENPDVRAKKRASNKAWAARNQERHRFLARRSHLKQRYGLAIEDYYALATSQKGKCALCGSANPRSRHGFHLDHDHQTQRVRGLLCQPCNHFVGHVEAGWSPPSQVTLESYLV